MDNLINDFYFNVFNKDNIYTCKGTIPINTIVYEENNNFKTFQFKINVTAALNNLPEHYKITELINLPFVKIASSYKLAYNIIEPYFSNLYIAYLSLFYKYDNKELTLLENTLYCLELEYGMSEFSVNRPNTESIILYIHSNINYIDKIIKYEKGWLVFKIQNKELWII